MNSNLYIRDRAIQLGLRFTEGQERQFEQYITLLLEWNEKINLTAITKREEVLEKHFIDSLMILQEMELPQNSKVIDIGTGAGFPAVPIKIMLPGLQVTLVDALQKRVRFLEKLLQRLDLNAEILHARAEELIMQEGRREAYDFVVSRAVAKLNMLAEYALPFLQVGGYFVSWKGPANEIEMTEAAHAVELLGGIYAANQEYVLQTGEKRMLIWIKKIKPTPTEYPRRNAIIKSNPL